jgi:hypothetical protein
MTQYFRLIGDPERAIDAGRRAIAVAESIRDVRLAADTNYGLAQVYRSRGDYREAARLLIRNIGLPGQGALGTTPSVQTETAVSLPHPTGVLLCRAWGVELGYCGGRGITPPGQRDEQVGPDCGRA